MNILRADPDARPLTVEEVHLFLERPHLLRLGVVDGDGYPVIYPLWHVFHDGAFWMTTARDSRKVHLLRENPRVYFTIDIGDAGRAPRGVRGRADAQVIDDQPDLTVDIVRQTLSRYMDTTHGPMAEQFIEAARQGETCVIRLVPVYMASWSYR